MNLLAQTRGVKREWLRGALLVAAVAACQAGDPDGPGGNEDVSAALAALPEAEVMQYSADGVAQIVRGELGRVGAAHAAASVEHDAGLRAALPPILKAFRLEAADLALRKVNVDEAGGRHYRYDQVFQGLPVVGGELVVHVDGRGVITGINGTARGDIARSLGARAVARGAASVSIEGDARWAGMTGRTIRDARTVYLQTGAGTLHKAYEQIVEGQRGEAPVIDRVYVDVETGAILAVHPQIQHARNRTTYSANNGTALPGTLKRTEAQGPTGDLDVDAAHDNAGHVYDLYRTLWNRDGIDNAGMAMNSVVHYSNGYCGAFWNNTYMVYGDGNASQNCGPLARSIDLAAHELTHGVTSRESNLTYSGESGGLNESLSDIWGAGVEAWVDAGKSPTPPFSFSLANDVFLAGDTIMPPFIRSMCDPAADGVSKDVWYSGIGSIDVHYSSGPNNLAFCLLAKGGVHPRGATTNPVAAIGMEKALRVMYKVNVDLATSSTSYASWRNLAVLAAQQLGFTQAEQDAVACAYAAIKVGTAPASCGGSPPPPPPPITPLANGVPVTGITDSAVGTFRYYSLVVPSAQGTLTFSMSGGTGDADLYVNLGAPPTDTVYQCRPYLGGNAETCTFTPPQAGTYFVGIRTHAAYSGLTLTGAYSVSDGGCFTGDPVLTSGVGQVLAGAASSNTYRCIPNIPAGRTLTVKISGGTGDADLYTQFNARPTTTSYACRPYLSGNTETCTHANAAAGTWYVLLRGFAAYSGTTLIGSY